MTAVWMSLFSGFLLVLILERAERISIALVRAAARFLPEQVRDARSEQWAADISTVEGAAWKLITAIGITWICRFDVIEHFTSIRFDKKFVVINYPTKGGAVFNIVWRYCDMVPCTTLVVNMMIQDIIKLKGHHAVLDLIEQIHSRKRIEKPLGNGNRVYFTNVPPVQIDAMLKIEGGNAVMVRTSN